MASRPACRRGDGGNGELRPSATRCARRRSGCSRSRASIYGLIASGIGLFNESILAERGFAPDVYYRALAVTAITGLAGNFAAGAFADRGSLRQVLVAALVILTAALAALAQRLHRRARDGAGRGDGHRRRLRDGRVLQLLGTRVWPRPPRAHPGRRAGDDRARLGDRARCSSRCGSRPPGRMPQRSTHSPLSSRRSRSRRRSFPFRPVRRPRPSGPRSRDAPGTTRRPRPALLLADEPRRGRSVWRPRWRCSPARCSSVTPCAAACAIWCCSVSAPPMWWSSLLDFFRERCQRRAPDARASSRAAR